VLQAESGPLPLRRHPPPPAERPLAGPLTTCSPRAYHVQRLVSAGHTVALANQKEKAATKKRQKSAGPFEREVGRDFVRFCRLLLSNPALGDRHLHQVNSHSGGRQQRPTPASSRGSHHPPHTHTHTHTRTHTHTHTSFKGRPSTLPDVHLGSSRQPQSQYQRSNQRMRALLSHCAHAEWNNTNSYCRSSALQIQVNVLAVEPQSGDVVW
jgi:hypothetical protein